MTFPCHDVTWSCLPNFKNKSENHRDDEGRRCTVVDNREGEGWDKNRVSLFYFLVSCLSCFNLYEFHKHDVLFFDYELTH